MLALGGFTFYYFTESKKEIKQEIVKPKILPLCVVFDQDVSQSDTENGVELITSDIFTPYFEDANRDIELFFGCISNSSTHKLIEINLPAPGFSKPVLQNGDVSFLEKKKQKQKYDTDLKAYQIDSINYYTNRATQIKLFSFKVDSLIAIYKNHLTSKTDVATAAGNADKVFSSHKNSSVQNVLIMNSDGEDSFSKKITMQNKCLAILVNSGNAKIKTSVRSFISITLQSPEEAIQYSLKN